MMHVEQPSTDANKPTSVGDVVAYLHSAGQQYREHIELLRRHKAIVEKEGAPFRPTISLHAQRMHEASLERQSEPIEDRLLQVVEARRARAAEYASMREDEHNSRLQACTFTPAVTRMAAQLDRSDVVETQEAWTKVHRERLERAKRVALREELREMSAAPRLSPYSEQLAAAQRDPNELIEDRLLHHDELRRQRLYEQAEMAANGLGHSEATTRRPFSPQISARAARMHRDAADCSQRLHTLHTNHTRLDISDDGCTFHPKLTPASNVLWQNFYKDPAAAGAEVHERLYTHASRQASHARADVSALSDDSHRPSINPNSQRIVAERRATRRSGSAVSSAMGSECSSQRSGDASPGSRLHSTTTSSYRQGLPSAAVQRQEQRTAEELQRCTFRPAINPTSDALWRRKVELLTHGRSSAEARRMLEQQSAARRASNEEKLRQARTAREREACTFAPTAVHGKPIRGPHRRTNLPIDERTIVWDDQRRQRLEELRAELERQKLAECTFAPQVEAAYPLPRAANAPIPGAEAYLHRQELARQQREEAAQWWRPRAPSDAAMPPSPSPSRHSRSTPRHASHRTSSSPHGGYEEDAYDDSPQPHTDDHHHHHHHHRNSHGRSGSRSSSWIDDDTYITQQKPRRNTSMDQPTRSTRQLY